MPEIEQDAVWTVCESCGAVVAAAAVHADWHTRTDPAPQPVPDTEEP